MLVPVEVLDGGSGNDRLIAGDRDTLVGGAGDDEFFVNGGTKNTLIGGSGADLFWLVNNSISQNSTIADFQLGVDRIGISRWGVSFNSLSFNQIGSDTVMSLNRQNLVTFEGIQAARLNINNFTFVEF